MKTKLHKLLTEARKAQNKLEILAYSQALSAIQESETRQNRILSEEECLKLIEKEKQTQLEIADLYKEKNCEKSISATLQSVILKELLPEKIDESRYEKIVVAAIIDCEASSIKEMGKVMAFLKEHHGMSLDYKKISPMVKKRLVSFS